MSPGAGWELSHSAMQVDNKEVCTSPVDLLTAQPGDTWVWRGREEDVLTPLIGSYWPKIESA